MRGKREGGGAKKGGRGELKKRGGIVSPRENWLWLVLRVEARELINICLISSS